MFDEQYQNEQKDLSAQKHISPDSESEDSGYSEQHCVQSLNKVAG